RTLLRVHHRKRLDGSLIVAVSVDLEPVELDLLDVQAGGLLHHLHPVLQGLSGMAEDELDVHLEAQLARVLDRFDRGGGVVSSIHDAENVVVERLDTDRQPVDTEIAEDVQPLPTLGADKRAGVNVVVELSTAPEVDSVREEPEEPRELRRRQVRGRAPPPRGSSGRVSGRRPAAACRCPSPFPSRPDTYPSPPLVPSQA